MAFWGLNNFMSRANLMDEEKGRTDRQHITNIWDTYFTTDTAVKKANIVPEEFLADVKKIVDFHREKQATSSKDPKKKKKQKT